MIGDRRRHPREPVGRHFRRLGEPERREPLSEPLCELQSELASDTAPSGPCRFEVYRTDEVAMNSTQFAGGDWHWRLCDEAGRVLVDAGGYRDERACRAAVTILRAQARGASVAPNA